MRHFCTYFDHRYLARGLALHESLTAHASDVVLWIMCLSDECESALRALQLPHVRLMSLRELEEGDPELHATRSTRSTVEYYFTCSPCFPRYLLAAHPEIDSITYLDADLYFLSDPEPIFNEIGSASIGITPHRFPRGRGDPDRFGVYNVGWLTFRNDEQAAACLGWWRDRCLEWCFDRVEPDRFADQKYLDKFPHLFPGVHVISHPGANLAPWNVSGTSIVQNGDVVLVDGFPLVFFHVQGLKEINRQAYDTSLDDYGARLTPCLKSAVYLPYLHALSRARARLGELDVSIAAGSRLRGTAARSLRGMLEKAGSRLRAELTGSVIRP